MSAPTIAQEDSVQRPPVQYLAGLPLLYEDDEDPELGDAYNHSLNLGILQWALEAHLANRSGCRVFPNMNLYYHPLDPTAYVSPDVMVVFPFRGLGDNVKSYRLGTDGPVPELTMEVLSQRTAQQGDLGIKIPLYAQLGVSEYILVDEEGRRLPQRLLLKRLQPDGSYLDEQDADGGVTSRLGFRLVLEEGGLRVIHSSTGIRYVRPREAEQEAQARRLAEEKQRQEAQARRQAEEKLQLVEEKQRQEAEARRLAEEKQRQDAEARRLAEEKLLQAEEKQRQGAEARRKMEEQLQALQDELQRLRQAAEKQHP